MRHFQKNTGIYFLFAVFIIGAYAGIRTAPIFGSETTIDAWGNEFAHYPSFGFLSTVFSATTSQSRVQINNASPTVPSVTLNDGNAITLVGNATKTVNVGFVVSDNNGCSDVLTNGTTSVKVFRHAAGSSCADDTRNCYTGRLISNDCSGSNPSANATASVDLYYFADATDSSSSYDAQGWFAYVQVSDLSGVASSATSTAIEVNTLVSIDVSSSTNYGNIQVGQNTSTTNQTVTVKNAGNSSTSLKINGTAMTFSGNLIATSSQHYATGTFTYGGGEQALQETATDVSGFLISRPPLTSWAATTPLPSGIETHPAVVNNGFIYTAGGFDNTSNLTSTVFYAPINSSGSLGSWATTTPLPRALYTHPAVVNNGFIYTAGGIDSGGITSTVFYAPINSTGSLGSWATTTPLPRTLRSHPAVVNNDFIYTAGGIDSTGNPTSTVFYAPINSNGTLGSWGRTAPLPGTFSSLPAVVNNGFIYTAGGRDNVGSGTSTVFFAPINPSGTLGSWATTTPLPSTIYNHPAVVNNGFIYTAGGFDSGGNRTSTVFYAPLASRNTFWGLSVSSSVPLGTYNGVNAFTAVWSP